MNLKEIDLTRFSGLCGILAPIMGLGSIFISISLLPWFSWTENYLSDIGGTPGSDSLWGTYGTASLIFNFGFVAAGILGIIFGFGVRKSSFVKGNLGNLATVFFVLDAAALIGVGLFTESIGAWHTHFSIAFSILVGLALGFLSLAFLRSGERKFGLLSTALLIFGLTAVPLFVTPKPIGSNAVAEIIPIISVSVFYMLFGYMMFNAKQREGQDE